MAAYGDVLASVAGVGAALAVLIWVLAAPSVMRRFSVPSSRAGQGTGSVSVVVAVRDEAPRVARLIASLRAQDHPQFEVIVVDDRSSDATAKVARDAICDDGRLRVIESGARPVGWQGRLWAQGQGAELARNELLIFMSGDQEIASTGFLRDLVVEYWRQPEEPMAVVGPFTGEAWYFRTWFLPVMNNPFLMGALIGIQGLEPDRPLFIGAPVMSRSLYRELGGVRAAALCGAGGWDDHGWSNLFERAGHGARMRYHPALVDHSNWTDFGTFWGAWLRWKAGVLAFTKFGWIAAGILLAILVAPSVAVASMALALLAGEVPGAVVWAWVLLPVVAGLVYCRWSGEPRWRSLTLWLTATLNAVSLIGAMWTRLRNRSDWRNERMAFDASPGPPRDDRRS